MLLSRERQEEEDTSVGKAVSLCRLFDTQWGCVILCVCVYVFLCHICMCMCLSM